jgi:citrate lyase subunit beta/citryl-CoA lyase/(S)-citramalyl-CoA lyase
MERTQQKARRCLLFVPGNKPDRFEKALAAGADMVCIDLEDAVLPADKVSARDSVLSFLKGANPACELVVRVNRVSEDLGKADLEALAKSETPPHLIMLPKVESAAEVQWAEELLGDYQVGIIALIESPRGVLNADAIASAGKRTQALMFGGADFAAELGGDMAWEPLYHARSHLSMVASAHGLEVIDVPYLDVKNDDGLAEECRRIKAMGFGCKSAIHPVQVAVINQIFTPTDEQVAKAERIVQGFEQADGGAALVDGKLVDRPVVLLAQRTLAIARAANQ